MSTVLPGGSGPVAPASVGSPTPPAVSDGGARSAPVATPVKVQPAEPVRAAPKSEPVSRPAPEQPREASRPIADTTTPALSTYQDQSSGRLVVKVFDRTSGQVLAEFPPERSLQFYPRQDPNIPQIPVQSVEVEA